MSYRSIHEERQNEVVLGDEDEEAGCRLELGPERSPAPSQRLMQDANFLASRPVPSAISVAFWHYNLRHAVAIRLFLDAFDKVSSLRRRQARLNTY